MIVDTNQYSWFMLYPLKYSNVFQCKKIRDHFMIGLL